ncbi:MAG TPA: hypothetical protein VFV71_09015 [Burkholderiales bacterium]|nr:hypothetical protein [Burkholderiales bacterium]
MRKFLLLSLLLAAPLASRAADDNKMLYVEYRLTGEQVAPGSFDSLVKKVWRVGDRMLRFEDAPNPQTKMHGLIVVSEPDIWVVDRSTNEGQHTVDPGPDLKVRFPIFASEKSSRLAELEFGSELTFFRGYDARELAPAVVDGVRCRLLNLPDVDERDLTLYLKPDDTPLQIVLKTKDYEYAVRFLRYEPDHQLNRSLFHPPPEAKIKG